MLSTAFLIVESFVYFAASFEIANAISANLVPDYLRVI